MWKFARLRLVMVAIVFAGGLVVPGRFCVPAVGMQPPQGVEQRGLQQLILETEMALESQNWLEASEKLNQAWIMATEKEDPLMTSAGTDVRQLLPGSTEILAGGKSRLEALFRNSAPAFRNEFTRQFSDLAATQISAALEKRDFREIERLTTRYAFCPSAQTGLKILIFRALDRADFLEAALLMGRLQRMQEEPDAAIMIQTAVCYSRAGLQQDAIDLVRLAMRSAESVSLTVGNRDLRLPEADSEIKVWIETLTGNSRKASAGWLQPGGDYRRSSEQARGPAKLQAVWKSDLYEVRDVLYSDQYNPLLAEYRGPVEQEASRLLQRNSTIIPTGLPLISDGNAVLRTPFGIRCVDLQTGELQWEVTRPDSVLRTIVEERTNGKRATEDPRRGGPFSTFQFMDPRAQLLYQSVRTNTASQMSISGDTLFVVDESSGATWSEDFAFGMAGNGDLTIPSNFIRAYDVRTGLFKWEVGGQTQSAAQPAGKGNRLAGFFFLGAPLVLGQRTYVLAESGEGLFLIQIAEPVEGASAMGRRADDPSAEEQFGNPGIVRSQILTVPEYKLPQHPVRKHAGLVPSFAQGILVCPTCDQRIVAVSADDHSLRWVFRYGGNTRMQEIGGDNLVLFGGRDSYDSRSVDLDSRWTDSLPRISNNRVFVTPRDSDQLYCLDLQTGKELWKAPRGPYHSIGTITSDRIVLIGNQRVAALQTEDGREVWTTQLRDGVVCGTAASDGRVIHIPTDEPAIVSLDLSNGRRLVRQSGDLHKMPGNLLITDLGMLTQNLTSISFFARSTGESEPSMMEQATEMLLDRRPDDARRLLDLELTSSPLNVDARDMLIELLLEGLRSDFPAYQSAIPRAQELIELSSREIALAPMLHSLLGMNLPDAAALPGLMRGRADRYRGELSELVAAGLNSGGAGSAEMLTASIQQLLAELPAAKREVSTFGFLVRSKAAVLTAGIRNAVSALPQPEQMQVQSGLADAAVAILNSLPDDGSRLEFFASLLQCGLPELMLTSMSRVSFEAFAEQQWLLREFARIEISQSNSSSAPQAAADLLNSWKEAGDLTAVRTWIADVSQPVVEQSSQRMKMADASVRADVTEAWSAENRGLVEKPESLWALNPVKTQSAARTMMELARTPEGIPDKLIPLYGPPGLFRGWSFVRVRPAGNLCAYDGDGVLRWKMQPFTVPDDSRYGFASDSYVTVFGHLLIINLSGTLFAVDAASVNGEGEPLTLWRKNVERLSPDAEAGEYREYVPPSDRVPQYFPQPAGYFPAAPATALGVPVISGRRLIVLDPLTGVRNWQVDGIARDAVLLVDADSVLVLSEGARQIEVRSLVDGSVRSIARLPEWWGEANLNVGSSVKDIDVEAGVDLLWRVVLQDRNCLLFRLTDGKSVLEYRDLLTDTVTWSVELPENTVFSNVIDDVVAVLSDGSKLKLIQTDSGRVLFEDTVTEVSEPRNLFLIRSSGHYIVLPEAVENGDLEYDPVIDAMHVLGRVYCISESDMSLAWERELDHRHIRVAIPERSVMLNNVPVLLLLSRGGQPNPQSPIRRTQYGALVLDVRTGEELFEEEDAGTTMNNLWMHVDHVARKIQLSFDSRVFTLDYAEDPETPNAP